MATVHTSAITFLDSSGEKSTFKLYNGALTVTSLPGFLTDFGNLKAATAAITNGTMHRETITLDNTLLSNALPSVPAFRELKILISYEGNTNNKRYSLTIPTPDAGVLTLAGDSVTLADSGPMSAWVTAFEAIARTPDDDTETVTVLSARIVGRNI